MADAYKFQSYSGGAGNYFQVELDPNKKVVEVVAEGFDLAAGTVTVEYQSKFVPTTDAWIPVDVPAGAETHLVLADGSISRIRILEESAGTYEVCVFQ